MRRKFFWIVPWIWLAAVSGRAADPRGSVTATPAALAPVKPEIHSPVPPPRSCASWRWVGVLKKAGTTCPVAQGDRWHRWQSGPLFEPSRSTTARVAGAAPLHPSELSAFCLYQYSGPANPDTHPVFLPGSPPIQLAPDCAGVVPQGDAPPATSEVEARQAVLDPSASLLSSGDELELAVGPTLESHFLAQAGQVALTSVARPAVSPGTRLALLDTQPFGSGVPTVPGTSQHGYSLAQAMGRLVCTGSGGRPEARSPLSLAPVCIAAITTRLALPIVNFDSTSPTNTQINFVQGGNFGSLTHLAVAIVEEVDDWRLHSPKQHLVLNLSLGWDGDLFGGREANVEDMLLPVQAVYRALEYASRQGALVIAASGNRVAGPRQGRGPLYPAAWESRRGEPLVYAVGGVQTGGRPLSNARPGSIPERMAYADHAWIKAKPQAAMLTGSSVATAVVSATAAAVWHVQPGLSRRDLMDLLERNGDDLGLLADFWNNNGSSMKAPKVRRISFCTALADVCKATGRCSLTCNPWSKALPSLSPAKSTVMIDLSNFKILNMSANFGNSGGLDPRCLQRQVRVPLGISPVDPCFPEQYTEPRGEPWNCPQPMDAPCPSCVMVPPPAGTTGRIISPGGPPPTVVRVQLGPGSPSPLVLATLDIDRRNGSPPVRYLINQPISKTNGVIELSLATETSLADAAVTVTFMVPAANSKPKQAILNEVFVDF